MAVNEIHRVVREISPSAITRKRKRKRREERKRRVKGGERTNRTSYLAVLQVTLVEVRAREEGELHDRKSSSKGSEARTAPYRRPAA